MAFMADDDSFFAVVDGIHICSWWWWVFMADNEVYLSVALDVSLDGSVFFIWVMFLWLEIGYIEQCTWFIQDEVVNSVFVL